MSLATLLSIHLIRNQEVPTSFSQVNTHKFAEMTRNRKIVAATSYARARSYSLIIISLNIQVAGCRELQVSDLPVAKLRHIQLGSTYGRTSSPLLRVLERKDKAFDNEN